MELGQFPSRFRQSDGRGRWSHIVARASPPALWCLDIFRHGTNVNPSFPTRGVDDPRSRSRTTSWSKGLPHKRDVLGLAQKLSARADSGRRLGRQSELELFEQKLVV